jgi:hypothetical protein
MQFAAQVAGGGSTTPAIRGPRADPRQGPSSPDPRRADPVRTSGLKPLLTCRSRVLEPHTAGTVNLTPTSARRASRLPVTTRARTAPTHLGRELVRRSAANSSALQCAHTRSPPWCSTCPRSGDARRCIRRPADPLCDGPADSWESRSRKREAAVPTREAQRGVVLRSLRPHRVSSALPGCAGRWRRQPRRRLGKAASSSVITNRGMLRWLP